MGTKIVMGFDLESPQYLDSRQSFETLDEMNSCNTILFPDGFITFCQENKQHYILDKELNSWEAFPSTEVDMYMDYTNLIEIINTLRHDLTYTNSQLKKLQERLDSYEYDITKDK